MSKNGKNQKGYQIYSSAIEMKKMQKCNENAGVQVYCVYYHLEKKDCPKTCYYAKALDNKLVNNLE